MQALIDFLKGFAEIISSLVNFVIGIVQDLLYVISLLGSLIVKIPQMLGWLPSACITLVVTMFAVVLIYKILGREG